MKYIRDVMATMKTMIDWAREFLFIEILCFLNLKIYLHLRPHPESNGGTPKGLVFKTSAIPLCDVGNNNGRKF